jgi:antitoxin component of RelBE/YafQ-DinJ toxin-antitoxin module
MARRSTDLVQVGLRLREGVRLKVWAAARKNCIPFNRELHNRIERSFEAETARTLEEVVVDVTSQLARYRKTASS